ncbi:TonB-dependent receptor plug domain-containing protein [Arcobacter roscoffensis]|uniref:TonB-dependent receptor n=1 Tax=Arcobacter roscoffensis TaxID=2961520 RepID=A0ABY5E136_9BACT|nr:TonB-dependent receptor [Arcobacter roscoffensis]UTJ05259.1 TonB-dependent receptor [Arcobacter roscoffensis]
MKIKHSLFAVSLILTVNANAQDITLDSIVVSTTSLGSQKKVDDVQASIQVIDKKTIEKSNSRSLPQLLGQAVGLTVNDGGSTSWLKIRGFSEDHTLILVDGLRRTGKYGSFDLSSVQLEDVQRVEIVRGPMSTLYGADAIAGVVNIITKKKPLKDYTKLSILAGTAQNHERDTLITKISGTKTYDSISHNYSIELREKDSYRLDKSQSDTDLRNESRQFINYGHTIDINDNTILNNKLEYSRQDDDGIRTTTYKTYEKENRYQVSSNLNYINDDYIIDSSISYGYSDTKVDRGSGKETTDYKQLEFNNYFRHFTNDNMVNIAGLGYKHDDIEVSMYTQSATRDNVFALLQNEYNITDSLTSNLGIRYDNFSDFGSTINPKASLMYKFSDVTLRTSYGEAFKAPSFTNMYSHFTRGRPGRISDISGNPDLKPEESKTYEFAFAYNKNNFDFEVVHHRTKLDNLINSYISSVAGTTSYYTYKNIDKAKIDGTELSLAYKFNNGFSVNTSVEHLNTKDESTGERLTGSAKVTYKMNVSYEYDKYTAYLNVQRFNNYYGANENRVNENSDYTSADLKLDYRYSKNTTFYIGVDNIQDKQMPYNMTLRGTPNDPGERFYYTGLVYTF